MANQKSSVFASRKRTPRTKPATTKTVITPATDPDGPILGRSLGPDWLAYASGINSALAEAARREKVSVGPDDVCTILNEMSFAPMFRLLVADLKDSLSKPHREEPDWCTTLFAARVFTAGLIAGRWEASEVSR